MCLVEEGQEYERLEKVEQIILSINGMARPSAI